LFERKRQEGKRTDHQRGEREAKRREKQMNEMESDLIGE